MLRMWIFWDELASNITDVSPFNLKRKCATIIFYLFNGKFTIDCQLYYCTYLFQTHSQVSVTAISNTTGFPLYVI